MNVNQNACFFSLLCLMSQNFFLQQMSSLKKQHDDQNTKEANSLQFKSIVEARYYKS